MPGDLGICIWEGLAGVDGTSPGVETFENTGLWPRDSLAIEVSHGGKLDWILFSHFTNIFQLVLYDMAEF